MSSPESLPPRDLVGGRYTLEEAVGAGTFAVTYRARDAVLGRLVAVKVLRAHHAVDAAFVGRFEREARLAASVSHPNVVDVYDYGAFGDTFFIVMQFVPGRTLGDELTRRGRFGPTAAVAVVQQVLHGLSAIHAAGIVHRDIKPRNVLIGRDDGVARVTDFGVAHYPVDGSLTSQGTTVGTASYMAPEQARGGVIGPATDLYAAGVVLYELLTGRLPFVADNPLAVMLAHVQDAPPPLADVAPDLGIPPALESVLMRALAKDPVSRPASAGDLADLLGKAVAGEVVLGQSAAESRETLRLSVATAPAAGRASAGPAAAPRQRVERNERPLAMLPPVRRRRFELAWVAPLVVFVLALAAVGSLVGGGFWNGNRSGSGDGNEGGERLIAVGAESPSASTPSTATTTPNEASAATAGATIPATVTATATATATATGTVTAAAPTVTATVRSLTLAPREATAAATVTVQARTAATQALPTATLPPSATLVPTREPTPLPTATVPPTIEPTATMVPAPLPTPALVAEAPPPPPPIESAVGALGDGTTFPATDWQGGMSCDPTWYGRPCVAIYGGGGANGRATLGFNLDEVPTEGVALTFAGLGDETGQPFPFGVEVNGEFVGQVPNGFSNWNPGDHGPRGEAAPWSSRNLLIPASLLGAGTNEVTIVSLVEGEHASGLPYLLLGEATLSATGASGIDGGGSVAVAPAPLAEAVMLGVSAEDEGRTERGPTRATTSAQDTSGKSGEQKGKSAREKKGRGGSEED